MKSNAKKLLFLMIITMALIFSFCLSGFTYGPFDVNIGFDDGAKLGGECFAFGITATVDETNLFGYGVELRPTAEDDGAILTIRMLAASNDEDEPSADYFTIQCITSEDEDDASFGMRWGSMDEDFTVDEAIFGFYNSDFNYESGEDTPLLQSYLLGVIFHFDVLMGN